jgi:hypothetical protein
MLDLWILAMFPPQIEEMSAQSTHQQHDSEGCHQHLSPYADSANFGNKGFGALKRSQLLPVWAELSTVVSPPSFFRPKSIG